ncbi:hypothetical protein BJH93_04040 [Kocuria polaris]|nr:hypothetical protein [Kocuria polaris]
MARKTPTLNPGYAPEAASGRRQDPFESRACAAVPADRIDEVFFPPNGDHAFDPLRYAEARSYCLACPIRETCLDYALELEGGKAAQGRFGMYGGTTPTERARISRKRRAA